MSMKHIRQYARVFVLLIFLGVEIHSNAQTKKEQTMTTIKTNSSTLSNSIDDVAAIRELEQRFAAAVGAGDVDGIMENYIPDQTLHVFDVVSRKEYYGADAYRADWVDFFTHYKGAPKMIVSDLEITADDNIAFSHSLMTTKGTDIQGNPVDRTVRVSAGYRKINGKLLIVHEHISLPVNFMTGKFEAVPKP
jgi:ketosteroid isomerase-like protein